MTFDTLAFAPTRLPEPGEWDPGWWALRVLERIGLVRSVRLPEDLAPRPELIALDAAVVASTRTS